MALGIFGMGCKKCCNPCKGCHCTDDSQIQLTSTWTNYVCNGCTDLNTTVLPKVENWPYINNGDTCIPGGDNGCKLEKCYYYVFLEPECNPDDYVPYLFCGGNCTADLPCVKEFNCANMPFELYGYACGAIGTGILPTNFYRSCEVDCSASPSCDYSGGFTFIDPEDGIEKPYGECVGGYGGTLDCVPFIHHARVAVWQLLDKSKTGVGVSLVVDSQGLQARNGYAVFDGPCEEVDVDVTLSNICLTGITLNNCILPSVVNVKII